MKIYTIGFGPVDDCSLGNSTLQTIANLSNATYQQSKNISELRLIYDNISEQILAEIKLEAQTVTGNLSVTTLYPDSYLEFNYTPSTTAPGYMSIPVTLQTPRFGNNVSEGGLIIPAGVNTAEAKVSSYSGNEWTDRLLLNNPNLGVWTTIYDLSTYGNDYTTLGDPYIVHIPTNLIQSGVNNSIRISTGMSPTNRTGGSPDNSIIYTALLSATVDYEGVYGTAEGCTWFVEFDYGDNDTIAIPDGYNGTNRCYYSNASYNPEDTYQVVAYSLLSKLDFDNNGKVYVNFDENDIRLSSIITTNIPYLWGPTLIEVRAWQ